MSLHQYYGVESVKTSDRVVGLENPINCTIVQWLCPLIAIMVPMQIISISVLFVACKVHDRARSDDTFVRAAWDVLCTAALKSDMEKNKELARLNDPVCTCLLVLTHRRHTSSCSCMI